MENKHAPTFVLVQNWNIAHVSSPNLRETGDAHLSGLHVFPAQLSGATCHTEISFKRPPDAASGQKYTFCLRVSVPGCVDLSLVQV